MATTSSDMDFCHLMTTLQHTWNLPGEAVTFDFLEKPNPNNIQNVPCCDSTSSAAAVAEALLEGKALLVQFHRGT